MPEVIRFKVSKPDYSACADRWLSICVVNLSHYTDWEVQDYEFLETIFKRAKARGLQVEFYRPEREGVPAKVWTMDELEIVFRDHIEFR